MASIIAEFSVFDRILMKSHSVSLSPTATLGGYQSNAMDFGGGYLRVEDHRFAGFLDGDVD